MENAQRGRPSPSFRVGPHASRGLCPQPHRATHVFSHLHSQSHSHLCVHTLHTLTTHTLVHVHPHVCTHRHTRTLICTSTCLWALMPHTHAWVHTITYTPPLMLNLLSPQSP